MVYVFLAEGFEEIEAITTVDILRRAGLDVSVVGVGSRMITGSHGIHVAADTLDAEMICDEVEAVVLPGGPGAEHLEKADCVQRMLNCAVSVGAYLAAICAAPAILGHRGLLKEKRATCFPGYEDALEGAILCDESVVVDDHVITARGAGVTVDFALSIVAALVGEAESQKVRSQIQCRS